MGRCARALLLAAVALALVACRVEGRVDVRVARDGSGTVTVGVGLDAEARAKVGDLATAIRTSDLTEAGWKVAAPVTERSVTWIRATKAFRSPGDLGRVLDEVGLLRSWRLSVSDGFGSTTWRVTGKVVSTGSVDQFSDSALTAALDGLPVGLTPQEVAADVKSSGPVALTVHVAVPGSVDGRSTYTIDAVGGPAATRAVSVVGTESDAAVVRWLLVAGILAALGVAAVVAQRLRRDRAPRSAPGA